MRISDWSSDVCSSDLQRSRVATIVTADGNLERAVEGQAVTLALADEIDASRGDVIADAICGRGRQSRSDGCRGLIRCDHVHVRDLQSNSPRDKAADLKSVV